ncbi:TIGR01457 family HAD-type hydrolase [Shouchella rhizosphaerae]|uniref:TIGR01457 family HAD-type hydrolase n=1 Tax=Shouchella rhizosphaerae TaxID=866786 RepID=UPI003F80DA64
MKTYKSYLFDLDGTVYHGNEPIVSAIHFINKLANSHIPYGFVTNNSTRSPKQVAKRLNGMGILAEPWQIMTSSVATASYLQAKMSHSALYIIGEEGLFEALAAFAQTEDKPDAVVIGLDRAITHEKLSKAARFVANGADLIATNPDAMITTESGLVVGNGALVAAVAYATKTEPIVIGKPGAAIVEAAIKQLKLDPRHTVFVGDNYDTDLLAGIHAGIDTIHVQTGITTDLSAYKIQPTYSIPSLDDWPI